MELTTEQITDLGIVEDSVPKVNSFISDQIADAKKGFDGKANTDAEAIITGFLTKVETDTKITRNQGEKGGDYIPRAWSEFNTSRLSEVAASKLEWETKVKDFKGDNDLIKKISTLEGEKDGLLQKYADYDEVKIKSDKYSPLKEEYEANKLQVAFSGVKPNFPDTVNIYEAEAKWGEFKSGILDKYTIVFDDGKWKGKLKSNEYTIKNLSELVASDENLTKLAKGREQGGTGTKPIGKIEIEGVPFEVPKNVDSETKTKLIKDYLTKTIRLNPMSPSWATEFAKYNKLINDNILKTA